MGALLRQPQRSTLAGHRARAAAFIVEQRAQRRRSRCPSVVLFSCVFVGVGCRSCSRCSARSRPHPRELDEPVGRSRGHRHRDRRAVDTTSRPAGRSDLVCFFDRHRHVPHGRCASRASLRPREGARHRHEMFARGLSGWAPGRSYDADRSASSACAARRSWPECRSWRDGAPVAQTSLRRALTGRTAASGARGARADGADGMDGFTPLPPRARSANGSLFAFQAFSSPPLTSGARLDSSESSANIAISVDAGGRRASERSSAAAFGSHGFRRSVILSLAASVPSRC